jgi:hypothetical protein
MNAYDASTLTRHSRLKAGHWLSRIIPITLKNISTMTKIRSLLATALLILGVLLVEHTLAFTVTSISSTRCFSPCFLAATNEWEENYAKLQALQQAQTQAALVDVLMTGGSASDSSLVPIYLQGQGRIPVTTNSNKNTSQLVLYVTGNSAQDKTSACRSLLIPLASRNQLELILFAKSKRNLSKSVLLQLNTLLINRDNGLFDNLPWAIWSVDPQLRNRDAAGNLIDAKYHLGKRDAYYRFMGKDWQGTSAAIGNLALRLKYSLESDDADEPSSDKESSTSLAQRILELQLKELQLDLAQLESELAVARNNNHANVQQLEQDQVQLLERIVESKTKFADLTQDPEPSLVATVLEEIAQWTTQEGTNEAPYRGAMGYAPRLDTKNDIQESLRRPYTSPFDLLKEVLEDQLNAKVIGCVLEQTSLLQGNLALGGTVILQRIVATKTVELAGESVTVNTPEEEYGNEGVQGGETMIVECDSDEAIGVALSFGVPLKVESDIFERAAILAEPAGTTPETQNIWETLPTWTSVEGDMVLQVEGENTTASANRVSPISIPRTTTSLFDSILEPKPTKSPMFPTDNPVESLQQYDELSDSQKAKTLLEISNFKGRLPRPRVVRNAETNPLDQLLLPLIDESVRRRYVLRDAERRGDMEALEELRTQRSPRQRAKEQAEVARESGADEMADQLESEAEFLANLRADVTQDEGSYSRFLDRDDWYERERQATAKRVKKSSFGTLLDGIE